MTAGLLPRPAIELLCAGSELLKGQLNTHVPRISLLLAGRGLALSREATLPDDRAGLAREIRSALDRSDALIVSGGLGPTFDDVTREAAADALGLGLRFRPAILGRIKARFKRLGLRMPAENRRQAFVLSGAEVLVNKGGTAPGQLLTLPPGNGSGSRRIRTLVLLPGPFRELAPILEAQVLPRLKKRYAPRSVTERLSLHLAGIPESAADEKLSNLVATAGPGLSFTILSYPGQVDFHAYAIAKTSRQARAVLGRVRRKALAAVGRHVLWEGEAPLEAEVGRALTARRLTLAAAESCTGGMLASRLTDIPGASAFFLGGVTTYADALKKDLLRVRPKTLRRHGAVSRECCREMAEGIRRRTGCSLGLSVTGIAGPAGGTRSKPVGLVYIGVAGPGSKTTVHELRLSGDRGFIRTRATTRALQLLLESAARRPR
ncbi:MAG: CinA family nicotinamide mononucleotide deamidase-related protein [Elusimicrobia bacterium]|nr:CinA family nicotinamide mononucleotide deamidase-related protein [Elusimicrobiota bacterium]